MLSELATVLAAALELVEPAQRGFPTVAKTDIGAIRVALWRKRAYENYLAEHMPRDETRSGSSVVVTRHLTPDVHSAALAHAESLPLDFSELPPAEDRTTATAMEDELQSDARSP